MGKEPHQARVSSTQILSAWCSAFPGLDSRGPAASPGKMLNLSWGCVREHGGDPLNEDETVHKGKPVVMGPAPQHVPSAH